jgi:hypothetical protein
MVQPRVERKLVSVVVADVVGYSRLTELDEEGTHARLNVLQRDMLKPKISEHHGRIIKDTEFLHADADVELVGRLRCCPIAMSMCESDLAAFL